jgi:outer membrane lipopolysaccharide assembly protein LptE/RlpB
VPVSVTEYTFTVTPAVAGAVSVSVSTQLLRVLADAGADAAGNPSMAAALLAVMHDSIAPEVVSMCASIKKNDKKQGKLIRAAR